MKSGPSRVGNSTGKWGGGANHDRDLRGAEARASGNRPRATDRTAARRARVDAAGSDYERFLLEIATPLCRMLGTVLKAEGYPFQVHTPAGALRLASEKSENDFIELLLDTMDEPAVVVGRVSRGWGHKVMTHERPIREGARIEHLTEEDVLEFLLSEIEPFVQR